MVDPNGRKWEIKGERETGLVHARPNPDPGPRSIIPKAFSGKWTSAALLKSNIEDWLKKQWDAAEAATAQAGRAPLAEQAEVLNRKTAQESLDELPEEIKKELGDVLATAGEEEVETPKEAPKVSKKKTSKKKTGTK